MPMCRHRYANSRYFFEKRKRSRFLETYGSMLRMLKGISRTAGSAASSKAVRRSLVRCTTTASPVASSCTSTLTRRCRMTMSKVLKNISYMLCRVSSAMRSPTERLAVASSRTCFSNLYPM
ncbi:PP203 [Orf virus]|uniref:PP203 n=1 Tax=Orf virus TaxID=10258 RepID=F1AX52_ORFV|nr:PP203 [Orf virus]